MTFPIVATLQVISPNIEIATPPISTSEAASSSNSRIFAYRNYKRRLGFLDNLMK
eukprot:c31013_g1_i1 orf=44-208(+)